MSCKAFILFVHILTIPVCQVMGQLRLANEKTDSIAGGQLLSVGIGIQHGFIFAHSPSVENTRGAHPTGVELVLSSQRNDAASWELCNCFPRQGLLLAYYDYDTRILGNNFTAAYFLEPVYKISERSFLSFRGAAGVSWLTHPYDSILNPVNRSYSTRLNGYLVLGVGAWFNLSPRWWLNTSFNYQHISNGGMKQPNKGINWPTAGVVISYQQRNSNYPTAEKSKIKTWKKMPLRWDITLFGIARKATGENGERKRLALIGSGLQAARQIGRISNITGGFEIYKDGSLKAQLRRDTIFVPSIKAGIMAGHEFILGKFLLSQRLGVYVFDQTPYYDLLFHRWGLVYRMNRQLSLGFNLQAHRQVADFIDLRFSYSIQKNGNNN